MDSSTYIRFVESLIDRINPLVVREVRRALKSRIFILSFLLSLLISWLITLLFCLTVTNDQMQFGKPGHDLIGVYLSVLAVPLFLFLPYSSFKSIQSERQANTEELLVISNITPSGLVWGNLWTALVRTGLLLCAFLPFICFASMFNGFDALLCFLLLGEILFICGGLVIFGMMLPSMSRRGWWQMLCELIYWGMVLIITWGLLNKITDHQRYIDSMHDPILMYFHGYRDGSFGLGDRMLHMLINCYYLAIYYYITLAQVSFESENRSLGLRKLIVYWFLISGFYLIYVSVLVPSLLPTSLTMSWPSRYEIVGLFSFLNVTLIVEYTIKYFYHLNACTYFLVGVYLVSEPEVISTRTLNQLDKWNLWRVLSGVFVMGGSRGFVLVSCLLLGNFALAFLTSDHGFYTLINLAGMTGYALLILSVQCLFSQEVQGAHRYQNHERMLTMLISLTIFLIPDYALGIINHQDFIPRFGAHYMHPFSYGQTNSMLYFDVLIFVAFIGLLSIAVNTFVILRGLIALSKFQAPAIPHGQHEIARLPPQATPATTNS